MGEIADAMLDGTLCEGCGEYLGSGDGYSRYCAGCGDPDDDEPLFHLTLASTPTPFVCDTCGKGFREAAHRAQHCRDMRHKP